VPLTDMRQGSGAALVVLVSCILGDRRPSAKWPSTKSVSLLQVKEKTGADGNALTKVKGDDTIEDIMRDLKSLPQSAMCLSPAKRLNSQLCCAHDSEVRCVSPFDSLSARGTPCGPPGYHVFVCVRTFPLDIHRILYTLQSAPDAKNCVKPATMLNQWWCCGDESQENKCKPGSLSAVSNTPCGEGDLVEYVCVQVELQAIDDILDSLDAPPDASRCEPDLRMDDRVCCSNDRHGYKCEPGWSSRVSGTKCGSDKFQFVCVQDPKLGHPTKNPYPQLGHTTQYPTQNPYPQLGHTTGYPTQMQPTQDIHEIMSSLHSAPDASKCAGDSRPQGRHVCCADSPNVYCAAGYKAMVSRTQCSATGTFFVCVQ